MTRLLALVILLAPASARATGFTDIGDDIRDRVDFAVELHGLMRFRAELLHNLDLDRGPTPSGRPLFPVPLGDPGGQTLTHADMRLRSDVAFYAPGGAVAVKLRLDFLDNLALGSLPEGTPSVTTTQRSPDAPIHVERAYGEVLTPVGLLAAGRMGSHWGLGMLANGGDCADCDSGDSADRVAFLTPVAGHVWAVAYDFSSTGPFVDRRAPGRVVSLDPADDVHGLTLAVLDFRTDGARERRRRAGRTTIEYGAYVAHRWQDRDVPASYLSVAHDVALSPAQSVARGFTATAFDVWGRLTFPGARIELEAAVLVAGIDQASLIPGVRLRDPVESLQWGAVLESAFGDPTAPFGAGIDAGIASGDPAPGFGAFPGALDASPQPGDLDGPQATPGRDDRVDNFRFHPDYRVDRILFREIIGTVTDAVYVRPHARLAVWRHPTGELAAQLAAIASFAVEPASAPGGERPLGVELDPTLVYRSHDGFHVALEYAVLFPLGGLENPPLGLSPKPAQLLRARLGFVY